MPRISAPTVREHVARQERAILDAAADLFASRGVADTDLADIARAVGLARSSLYRYFPDKDHILAAWLGQEIDALDADVARIEAGHGPATDRIDAWIDAVLDWVGRSGGDVLPRLLSQVGAVSAEVRAMIGQGEARVREPLRRMVDEAARASNGTSEGNGNGTSASSDAASPPPPPGPSGDQRPGAAGCLDHVLAADLLLGAVDAGIDAVGRGTPTEVVRQALRSVARAVLATPATRPLAA